MDGFSAAEIADEYKKVTVKMAGMDVNSAIGGNGATIATVISAQAGESNIDLLAPAHSPLYDDAEISLAWDRLLAVAEGKTSIVPLLVCLDDLDFSCRLIVAEQVCRRGGLICTCPVVDVSPQWLFHREYCYAPSPYHL